MGSGSWGPDFIHSLYICSETQWLAGGGIHIGRLYLGPQYESMAQELRKDKTNGGQGGRDPAIALFNINCQGTVVG